MSTPNKSLADAIGRLDDALADTAVVCDDICYDELVYLRHTRGPTSGTGGAQMSTAKIIALLESRERCGELSPEHHWIADKADDDTIDGWLSEAEELRRQRDGLFEIYGRANARGVEMSKKTDAAYVAQLEILAERIAKETEIST